MSVVVTIRVSKELIQQINELIKRGLYSSRSDFVREALRRFMVSERAFTEKTTLGQVVARLASIMIGWNEKSVTDVILFGSIAREEATIESDVDLLVLTEDKEPWKVRRRLYDLLYPVIPAFGVDISLIVINKNDFTSMAEDRDPFAVSILNEGVQLQGEFINEYIKSAHGKSY